MQSKEAIKFLKKFTKMVEDTGFLLKGEEFIWVVTKLNGVRVLLEHRESENKKLKKFKDMWEWIQGIEMWNKEYEKVVKEVVQDIEVGYKSGEAIEQIGYERVADKGLVDGITKKQNEKYIKKINKLEALKQENEAYKGMWEALENKTFPKDYDKLGFALYNTQNYIRELKQKYLGGGE